MYDIKTRALSNFSRRDLTQEVGRMEGEEATCSSRTEFGHYSTGCRKLVKSLKQRSNRDYSVLADRTN